MAVRPVRVRTLLGYSVDDAEMVEILRRLSCEVAPQPAAMRAAPPTWRFDLAIEEDFVEEIARIHGYDHVPATPPLSSVPMLALEEGLRDLRIMMSIYEAARSGRTVKLA